MGVAYISGTSIENCIVIVVGRDICNNVIVAWRDIFVKKKRLINRKDWLSDGNLKKLEEERIL